MPEDVNCDDECEGRERSIISGDGARKGEKQFGIIVQLGIEASEGGLEFDVRRLGERLAMDWAP